MTSAKYLGAFLVAATLNLGAVAQEKKDDRKAQPIRVCVAQFRNVARRSVSLGLQRDLLVKDLNRTKPSKKAADQRRIEAVAVSSEQHEGDCDFILNVTIAELRDSSDFKTGRERVEDSGNARGTSSQNEPQTFARVDFALLYGGNPSPVMQDSFSARENMPEEATVQLLMDRIAQRVNSAAREKPEVMRE